MDIITLLLQLIILFFLVIAYFYLKNYYPKYFEEKGKNLATKEDVGEITKIVEGIKQELIKETELLKSQLALNNQNIFSIKNSEREALFSLNSKYSALINSLTRFSFTYYSEDNVELLDEASKLFNERQYEVDISKAHLFLFMHDKEIIQLINNLDSEALELEHLVSRNIIKVKYQYRIYNIKKSITAAENQVDLLNATHEEIKGIITQFHSDKLAVYKKIAPLRKELTSLIKKRIDSIVQ